VLFYDQQTEKSLPHLQFAADAGSQQAQFVLGYITDEGLQGVKRDPCKVEDLWVKSARQGRFAAQVSYANHVMTGRFGACPQQADAAEIAGFLDAAKKQAGGFGYYAVVLADVLARDFAAWRAANGK
jgi:TPR repeat protein